MDRRLISGALILLILQVLILIIDFDTFSLFSKTSLNVNHKAIGVIVEREQNLKRRHSNSIIWDDIWASEPVAYYDSILTLDNGSAHIRLMNTTDIFLDENTLVVIEPTSQSSTDDHLRIRFSRGNLQARNNTQELKLNVSDWDVLVSQGSEFKIKNVDQGQFEIEMQKGLAHLQNLQNPNMQQNIIAGTRTQFDQATISDVKTISNQLKIQNKTGERVYTHSFPLAYNLNWLGSAKQIRIVNSNYKTQVLPIDKMEQNKLIELQAGTSHISVQNAETTSSEFFIQVIPAPRIYYTSPLPRERFTDKTNLLFSWLPITEAKSYRVELENSYHEKESHTTNASNMRISPSLSGEVQWRVFAVDKLGYTIPPQYSQTFYVFKNLLPAPKLMIPTTRMPTSEKSEKNNTTPKSKKKNKKIKTKEIHSSTSVKANTIITLFKKLLSPSVAYAENLLHPQLIFSWYPVPGADFYNIEIATDAEFRNTIVMEKVNATKFTWKIFEKKIYYWRVAGGSNDGQMGLFSESAKLDLTNMTLTNDGEISPGVTLEQKITNTKIVKKNDIKKIASPSLVKKPDPVKKISPLPEKTPDGNEINKTDTPSQVEPPKNANKQTKFKNTLQFNTQYIQNNFSKEFSTSFSGFADLSLTAKTYVSGKFDKSYSLEANYTSTKWEPQNNKTWPFQNKFTETDLSLKGFVFSENQEIYFGVWVSNLTTLTRVDFEKISPKTIYLLGPATGYKTTINKDLNFDTAGAILYGQGYSMISSSTQLNYNVYPKFKNLYLGADLNFQIYFGTQSATGFNLNSGLHLGTTW